MKRYDRFLTFASTLIAVSPAMAVIQGDPNFTADGGRRVIDLTNPATLPSSIDPFYTNAGENMVAFGSNGFLAWPIGPRTFINARHVGLSPGSQTISFAGTTYSISAATDITGTFFDGNNNPFTSTSDIRVYTIAPTDPDLPRWAPLLQPTDTFANDAPLILYGTGVGRGTPITALPSSGPVRGWAFAQNAGPLSWGSNRLSGFIAINMGATNTTNLVTAALHFDLDPTGAGDGSTYEAGLGPIDSSGAVFIRTTDGQWKLAGINSAIDGPIGYTTNSSQAVNGVSFDLSGLHAAVLEGQPTGFAYQLRTSGRTSSFSTTVAYPDYANALAAFVPEPSTFALLAGTCTLLITRRHRPTN